MNVAQIRKIDVANGTGVRTTVFVSGCEHRCKGCFNSEYWDFSYGEDYEEKLDEIIEAVNNPVIQGLSILGGEPFHPFNLAGVYNMISVIKKECNKDNLNIWCWTGYTLEELRNRKSSLTDLILKEIDTLVDGRFILEKKDITLKFRGSSNQRICKLNQ